MSSSDRADSKRDPYEGMTRAQIRMAKQIEKAAANWKGVKVKKATGVSEETLAIERQALDYCQARGHRIRGGRGNPQGCRPDLQDALMGRLGQRSELPELPGKGVDPVTRIIDEILSDFGEHDLDGIWQQVNERRAEKGQEPITQTACAIRTREVREHGRTLLHRANESGSGSDVYWYERPNQPTF